METARSLYTIRAEDRRLVDEFRANPLGPYSPALWRLLCRLRWEPVEGRHVIVCMKPHEAWCIGRQSARRGTPVAVERGTVFHSLGDAEWAVFRRQWTACTGEQLP